MKSEVQQKFWEWVGGAIIATPFLFPLVYKITGNPLWLWLFSGWALAFVGLPIYIKFKRARMSQRSAAIAEATTVVSDSHVFKLTFMGRDIYQRGWQDLEKIFIETNNQGPFAEDLFWVFVDRQGKDMKIAGTAKGTKELLTRVQELPGFKNESFVQAMGSTEKRQFLCWQRPY